MSTPSQPLTFCFWKRLVLSLTKRVDASRGMARVQRSITFRLEGYKLLNDQSEQQVLADGSDTRDPKCTFVSPETASPSPYLLPLFWSRNSVAGRTISNWIGVPGAMSSSASGTWTAALGTILSFSSSKFLRFWLKYKRGREKSNPV